MTDTFTKTPGLRMLNDKDFHSDGTPKGDIAKKRTTVIFYADWCGHCKSTKPIYAGATTKCRHNDFIIGAVDCSDKEKMGENLSKAMEKYAQGFPTIVQFDKGKVVSYSGAREETALCKFF
jgi:thiol-disulfide isomerase/thioredoxin